MPALGSHFFVIGLVDLANSRYTELFAMNLALRIFGPFATTDTRLCNEFVEAILFKKNCLLRPACNKFSTLPNTAFDSKRYKCFGTSCISCSNSSRFKSSSISALTAKPAITVFGRSIPVFSGENVLSL